MQLSAMEKLIEGKQAGDHIVFSCKCCSFWGMRSADRFFSRSLWTWWSNEGSC